MFQNHSFEAFNASSHANLKCSLKYRATNSSLSQIKIQYFFGLSEKYQLTISESTLSYDMRFVFGNLKGYYEYLQSIHQEGKFQFCKFSKEEMRVSFHLRVFNQDKTVQQDFKSTQISDEVIWKSELKSKLENIQLTMNSRMDIQVDRKVRHSMIEERERSFHKSQAFEQKVNRQISLMKDKLDVVVNFINRQETTKQKLEFKDIRFRGRYGKRKGSRKGQSSEVQDDEKSQRRNTRSYESIIRTRPIQKEEKPPQRSDQTKSIRYSRELKKIISNSRTNQNKAIIYEKPSAAQKIEEWERQYEKLNFTNSMKVYPIFEKPHPQNLNNPPVQKRSRGRPASKFKQLAVSRPQEEPFIISKFQKNSDIQNLRPNVTTIFSKDNSNYDNIENRSQQNNIWSIKQSLSQQRVRNDSSRDSKFKSVENQSTSKGQQVARSLQQALKMYDPKMKNLENKLYQSARKNSVQNDKLFDKSSEKIQKKSLEKRQNQIEQDRKKKISYQAKSIDSRKDNDNFSLFRRQIFQKSAKPHETIDLEDEDEYKKFFIKIKSKKPQQAGQFIHFGKTNDQRVKMEQQESNNIKKQFHRQPINTGQPRHQNLTKQIANRIASRISDQFVQIEDMEKSSVNDNSDSQSENQISQLDKMVETYKKQKREERKEDLRNKIRLLNNTSEVRSGLNQSEQKDIRQNRQSAEQMSNIKMNTTPNSKASLESLHQMVDPEKEPDIDNMSPAKIPTYQFLNYVLHFRPNFTPNPKIVKIHNTKLQNYFEFESKANQIITKKSKTSRKGKKEYIPLISSEPLPHFGKHFWSIRVIWSGNYHICMGIVDMPSEIKLGQIPKNCDALYILDGGLHDEKGGNKKQNGWRPKDGAPVDVLQMELWMDKGEMYVIMVIDMDREEMSFYYNDQFISKTEFSTWCKKNKKRLHPYLAMKTEKDCIEVV